MNKKFASLGTALSRDEAKKIIGGNQTEEEVGDDSAAAICTSCTTDADCGLRVCRSSISCTQAKVCAKPHMC